MAAVAVVVVAEIWAIPEAQVIPALPQTQRRSMQFRLLPALHIQLVLVLPEAR